MGGKSSCERKREEGQEWEVNVQYFSNPYSLHHNRPKQDQKWSQLGHPSLGYCSDSCRDPPATGHNSPHPPQGSPDAAGEC